jgi:hypothetical protein
MANQSKRLTDLLKQVVMRGEENAVVRKNKKRGVDDECFRRVKSKKIKFFKKDRIQFKKARSNPI